MIDAAQYSALEDTISWCQKMTEIWYNDALVVSTRCSPLTRCYQTLCFKSSPRAYLTGLAIYTTQGDFAMQIKSKPKSTIIAKLPEDKKKRFKAVCRKSIMLHSKSHLTRHEQNSKSQSWQCQTSLFSLTSVSELTNEAIVNTRALLLGILKPHALFLKSQGG